MKSKATALVLVALLYTSTSGVVLAENSVSTHSNIINGEVAHSSDINSHMSVDSSEPSEHTSVKIEHGDATSSEMDNEHDSEDMDGSHMSKSHQSVVAHFVQSLLDVADHEGGIGPQVRIVAQSQHESASTTAEAMTEVDGRSAFHTFLVGSDYKNLGVIRSEIVSTTANLQKLKALLGDTTSDTDKVELNAQITALESEQAKVEAYVSVHEEVFSLFGWLNKLLRK